MCPHTNTLLCLSTVQQKNLLDSTDAVGLALFDSRVLSAAYPTGIHTRLTYAVYPKAILSGIQFILLYRNPPHGVQKP